MPDIRDELSGALSHEDPGPPRTDPDAEAAAQALLQGRQHRPCRRRWPQRCCSTAAPVRTPAKTAACGADALKLAEMLAAEWDAQVEVIDPGKMPVTRIANTALDGVAKDQRSVFDDILRFAGTDLALLPRQSSPEGLVGPAERTIWNPVTRMGRRSHSAPVSSWPKA